MHHVEEKQRVVKSNKRIMSGVETSVWLGAATGLNPAANTLL
jgi:hypothetical protein